MVYYDKDADVSNIMDRKIAIIGYGIQGKAHAFNLRDSGCSVIIGNIDDDYKKNALSDGFEVYTISEAVSKVSIVFLLLPDQAQQEIYNKDILPNLNDGDMLIFAHGYAIRFKKILPPSNIDVCLLAPRMPGEPIRESYLSNYGIPAFFDVYQEFTDSALKVLLGLAKAMGYTKPGVMQVSFAEETEIDLFIEQLFLPLLVKSIRVIYDTLVARGYTKEVILMELYGSGEIGELLKLAADRGLYRVWQENASPTCQFGIANSISNVFSEDKMKDLINSTMDKICDGEFDLELEKEAQNKYPKLTKYNQENMKSDLMKSHDNMTALIKIK